MTKMDVCLIGKETKELKEKVREYFGETWDEEEIDDFSKRLAAFEFNKCSRDPGKTILGLKELITK